MALFSSFRRLVFFLGAICLLLTFSLLYHGRSSFPPIAPPAVVRPSPLHITVTESGGSHDEVVAAVVHSFGSQPGAVLDLYQLLPRYNITGLMHTFPNPPPNPKSPSDFIQSGAVERRPDILVLATCELDAVYLAPVLPKLLADGHTYIFCVVHHADRWADPKMGLESALHPWLAANRIEFLTLSPHTSAYLATVGLSSWAAPAPRIRTLVPVFPRSAEADTVSTAPSFAIQGDYDPARRNYASAFSHLSTLLETAPNATMHLLGNGKRPQVPENVAKNVEFDESLSYPAYYAIVARAFALLPAFASNEYLDRKASSSVPASLIAGTPLVATRNILKAYSYLDEGVVWVQEEGEGDIEVVARVIKMGEEARAEKKAAVAKKCAELVEGNLKLVGGWVEEALTRIVRL